jgi:hypothetical protein
MRLNYPHEIDQAIEQIKSLQFQLENARSGLSPEGKRDNFVNWCDDRARNALGHLFDPSEEIFADLESAYIRTATTTLTDDRLHALMSREFSRWGQNLSRMERLLLEQQAVRDIPGHRIILDTSVLMEAVPPFIEFDWHSVHESMSVGSIRLIVPIIVIEELDEKLHDRDADRRKRARDAIRSLRSVHRTNRPTERAPLPDKPGVTLEILMDELSHRRQPNNDAEIIDQALQLHQLTGLAVLAACDTHMYYRAGAVDLPAYLVLQKATQG